jgi:carbon monoxide dehydrogenase subunit G
MVHACPIGEVAADADTVWSFLHDPRRMDLWWDARVERVEPEGPMTPGQRITATTRELGHTFHLTFDVKEVDVARRRVRILAHLPFGVTDDATFTVTPLGEGTSRLSFG